MELQSIRYAAMISTMTFDQAVDVFDRYLTQIKKADTDARAELLDFLGWDEPDEDAFAQDVRIVLASAEFSREVTASVLWLIDRGIDIRCVRLQPYNMGGHVLVDFQQIIPLPEAAEYQVQVREKARKEREARTSGAGFTRYDVTLGAQKYFAETKRWALYLVFRHLVESGLDPEALAAHCGRRSGRALYAVDGEVDRDEFMRLADIAMSAGGRKFRPNRFFCSEDEVIRRNGRTFAFSNQWGGDAWMEAMSGLRDAHPDRKITFTPVEMG